MTLRICSVEDFQSLYTFSNKEGSVVLKAPEKLTLDGSRTYVIGIFPLTGKVAIYEVLKKSLGRFDNVLDYLLRHQKQKYRPYCPQFVWEFSVLISNEQADGTVTFTQPDEENPLFIYRGYRPLTILDSLSVKLVFKIDEPFSVNLGLHSIRELVATLVQ